MRNLRELDQFRAPSHIGFADSATQGAFSFASPIDHQPLVVIASSDLGWDHVSVSRKNRCPNWTEMDYIKRTLFHDHETAMQLHVPPDDHVNMHPYVLHLWRPLDQDIPRPPAIMVGIGGEPVANYAGALARVVEHFKA